MHSEKLIAEWLQDNQPTRCPTLVADGVRFWSPCSQPELGVERPIKVMDFKAGVSAIFARPTLSRKTAQERGRIGAAKQIAEKAFRVKQVADMGEGTTPDQVMEAIGCNRKKARELMHLAGLPIPKPPRITVDMVECMRLHAEGKSFTQIGKLMGHDPRRIAASIRGTK